MATTAKMLTPQQQKQIEQNYNEILARVEADQIMDKFVDEGFFSIQDVVEDIMEKTGKKKTSCLLKLLKPPQNSEDSKHTIFDFFLRQLEEKVVEGKELAQKIRTTQIQVSPGTEDTSGGFPDVSEKVKDAKVTELHATYLSSAVKAGKVKTFGMSLGLGEAEISHIEHDSRKFTTRNVVKNIIDRWKNRNGTAPTLGKLWEQMKRHSRKIEFDMEALRDALRKIESSYNANFEYNIY